MLADDMLELLKDGQWHNVNEIMKTLNQEEELISRILYFYEDYGFIEFNKKRNKVVIDPKIKELFL